MTRTPPKKETQRLDDLWATVGRQVQSSPEFPLTSMSEAIANELSRQQPWRDNLFALDVGTGSGIHAFILHNIGYKTVLAIDVNEQASRLAFKRASDFKIPCTFVEKNSLPKLAEILSAQPVGIVFAAVSLDDLCSYCATKFGLIVFNPPAFFFIKPYPRPNLPAATGVYAAHISEATNSLRSHLFRFFKSVVLPLLEGDGHVVCSWPGLERRVVELEPNRPARSPAVHPAELLGRWMGMVIRHGQNSDSFYRNRAVISHDYNLGSHFEMTFRSCQAKPQCYSELLDRKDGRFDKPTFRFGVLHLVRFAESDKSFNLVTT